MFTTVLKSHLYDSIVIFRLFGSVVFISISFILCWYIFSLSYISFSFTENIDLHLMLSIAL